jgi:multicomponent Na+:H+ antiporter subunit D
VNVVIPLLVALPLFGAGLSMALWRSVPLQQIVGGAVLTACVALAVVTTAHVAAHGAVAVHMGGWAAPVGITLVADLLAALLLTVSLVTVLGVFVYAVGQPRADKGAYYFHALYLVLTAGVSAAFLTGDLFNLFVAFEIMLSASYVLITLGGRPEQVRSGMTYIVINLLASTLLVTAIGLVYAATGSVNMADVAVRFAQVPDGMQAALGALLLVTFGIKAAIFPLFFWLPDSYPTAPVAVTAVFAGLLTKIGVYAIIRTQTLLFPDGGGATIVLAAAALTMVVGVLGAMAQDDMKRILSFHIISQIGYMLLGLGLYTVSGIAAAIFFMIHQIPVKTAMFLVNGLVEAVTGTAALHSLGGLLRRSPLIAAMFLAGALSLAGIPPLSGFFGKVALIEAGFAREAWVVTGVSIAVSALTLLSMTKIWAGVFWGEPAEDPPLASARGTGPLKAPALMNAATVGVVGVTLAVAVFAQPLWELSLRASEGLLDAGPSYIDVVLSR